MSAGRHALDEIAIAMQQSFFADEEVEILPRHCRATRGMASDILRLRHSARWLGKPKRHPQAVIAMDQIPSYRLNWLEPREDIGSY